MIYDSSSSAYKNSAYFLCYIVLQLEYAGLRLLIRCDEMLKPAGNSLSEHLNLFDPVKNNRLRL